MDPGEPAISVVIPSRNRPLLLDRVLRALERQEGMEQDGFEIIVALDGDTQHTAQALRTESYDLELTVLELVHSGVAVARNAGWRAARADHVLFIDDDMVATPRLLAEHMVAIRQNPGQVILGRFSPDPAARRTAWTRYDELVQEKRYALYEHGERPSGVRCYSGNLAVPRALLEQVGGFDSRLPRNEDVDLGFRLQAAGARIVFAPLADALHCGYRDLSGWKKIPLTYGRLDVALYRDRGYAGGIDSIIATFHDRHPLNRALIHLALANEALRELSIRWACRLGVAFHILKLETLSYAAMSLATNLMYWTGVRDGLRGNDNFWRMVRLTRLHIERPYERAKSSELTPAQHGGVEAP